MRHGASLRWSLVRSAGLAVVAVGVLLTVLASLVFWRTYAIRESHAMAAHVLAVRESVKEFLRQPEVQTRTLANMLSSGAYRASEMELLKQFLAADPRIYNLHWLDRQGRVILGVGVGAMGPGIDFSGQDVVRAASQSGRLAWSSVIIQGREGILTAALAVPSGSGMVIAQLNLERFRDFRLPVSLASNVELIITDQSGVYVYHQDYSKVLQREVFSNFSELRNAQDSLGYSAAVYTGSRGEFYVNGAFLEGLNWCVVLQQSRDQRYYPLYMALLWLGGVSLLALLLVGLASFLVTRSLLSPLEVLMQRIRHVSAGEYQLGGAAETYHEFQDVSTLFDTMAENVRTREKELARLNNTLRRSLDEQKRTEAAFTATMRSASRSTGRDYCLDAVQGLCDWLGTDWSVIGELDSLGNMRLLVQWSQDAAEFDAESLLASQACEKVREQGYLALEEGLPAGFGTLVGVVVYDAAGKGVGVLLSLAYKKLSLPDRSREVLEVLAVRTGTEIARIYAEKELRSLANDLKLKNRDLEDMLYISSHDLRTPLVNIAGFAHELTNSANEVQALLGKKQQYSSSVIARIEEFTLSELPEALRFINASVSRMDVLQQGLLQLSRLNRGALELQLVDLKQLVSRVALDFQFRMDSMNARVIINDLPAVYGEVHTLSRLFANLFDNALKYARPGVAPTIVVSGERQGQYAVYRFQDNGIGISEMHLPKVFNIFYRAGEQTSITGEGLGLAIVQRVVDRHRGRIRVESVLGEGTTFILSLPMGPVEKSRS